jgi:isoleucyl-tRNA synthetase
MKFKKGTRRRALQYEKELVQYWKEHQTFEKSVQTRPADNAYVFYDGPPFITGVPHHGTLLTSIVKDAVPRYWTMKGKRVERVWGWDTHGLPAEVFTEKKLGIHDRRDIGTKVSLEDYINTCRENMIQTGSEWEDTIDRIGRWVDFKGAYKTMDKNYMESVWWAFKQLYDKGKIYEGERVLLYCTRDATPISKAEVAMDNSYQDVTDPSVYVKLRLKDFSLSSKDRLVSAGDNEKSLPVYLLAWTTTPWTLPANTAAAVNEDLEYAAVQVEDEVYIVARELVEKVFVDEKHQPVDYKVVQTLKGTDLIGKSYESLFAHRGANAHKIWAADYVTTEEGTGVVHLAPAYGEEDYSLAQERGFPFVSVIDDNGFYSEGDWQGQYVWDANKPIAKALHERGVVWKIDYIRHSYPHCHRCGTKLMYRAHPSWFMDINGQRALMLEQNSEVNWFPEHIKHGRSEKTIETAPDWNLSRDRFWATAMPVWKGTNKDGKELVKVVGSYAELKELSGVELEDYHRPWIDDVRFTIDGVGYTRIDKVMDCWFESGSMPFAQFHYPFENVEKFEHNFPGDFIVEYVPQVRAWFYYLSAVNNGLFGKVPFKTALVHGTLAGNDGRKMSKSFGNYTDPNELMDEYSADSLRYLFLSSPVLNGEDYALQDKDVADVARKLSMVWNMYDFFTLYADVDGWDSGLAPGELPADPSAELQNPLDTWIVSRVHQLNQEVDTHMQKYDLPNATKPILPFLDDASNWYVRRSRKRFWKSDNDSDKQHAYKTLHYVLTQLSMIMAPFTPFLAEELYHKLIGGESVHLLDWPASGGVDETIIHEMHRLREVITLGLAQRAEAGIKVRQPLKKITAQGDDAGLLRKYEYIVTEELNIKFVEEIGGDTLPEPLIDTELTDELKREGLMREIVRNVQQARKQADLQVDDRIDLQLTTTSVSLNAVLTDDNLYNVVKQETLALHLNEGETEGFVAEVKIEGEPLTITLSKVPTSGV